MERIRTDPSPRSPSSQPHQLTTERGYHFRFTVLTEGRGSTRRVGERAYRAFSRLSFRPADFSSANDDKSAFVRRAGGNTLQSAAIPFPYGRRTEKAVNLRSAPHRYVEGTEVPCAFHDLTDQQAFLYSEASPRLSAFPELESELTSPL